MWAKIIPNRKPAKDIIDDLRQLFLDNRNEEVDKLLHNLRKRELAPPEQIALWMYTGWLHYRRQEYDQALIYAHQTLAEVKDGYFAGKAHHLAGLCLHYFLMQDDEILDAEVERILNEFEVAQNKLSGHPEQVWVYDAQANLLISIGRETEAVELLRNVVDNAEETTPEIGWTYATLGEILVQDMGDWKNGKQYLEKAINILDSTSSTHAWVHALMAYEYNIQDQPDKALVFASKALELIEKDGDIQAWVKVRAHMQYAIALARNNGDLKLAEKHYKVVLQLTGDDSVTQADVYRRLGNLYCDINRNEAALKAYQKAVDTNLGSVESDILYWNMATTARELRKWEDALKYFKLSLEHTKDNSDHEIDVYYNIGYVCYQQKKYSEAGKAFREALRLMNPDDSRRPNTLKYLAVANEAADNI